VNYHKDRFLLVFKLSPSIGAYVYQTFYDQLDEKTNKNDYYNVVNLNELGVSDRTEIIKELANLRDGVYETNAEEHLTLDEDKLLDYNIRLAYGLDVGIAIRLNKFLSLDIETRHTFLNDDLIDGMQWQEPGETSTQSISTTTGKDSYNQTTLGITYRFATKKLVNH
jgi:hypothetical protein